MKALEKNFEGMEVMFIEPDVNREASTYLAKNWDKVYQNLVKWQWVPEQSVHDLMSDVWLSIKKAEDMGDGFDVSYSNEGDAITVEQFVYGRMKGYSRNDRYHPGEFERRKTKKAENRVSISLASCSDDTDLDALSSIQKAYALASTADDTEAVDLELSLRSNILYCMNYNEHIGFNILNLFKNIDMFGKSGFNNSIFDKLRSTAKAYKDFGEALQEVLTCSAECSSFEAVLASI